MENQDSTASRNDRSSDGFPHPTEWKADAHIRLTRSDDGRLILHQPDRKVFVTLRPCFPWHAATRFISLRDVDSNEVALIEDIDALDDASRTALLAALDETRFTFMVTAVKEIVTDFELRLWSVETSSGDRSFATEWDDHPREMSDGSLVLKDLSGDLYRFPDFEQLDGRSQRLLWSFRR